MTESLLIIGPVRLTMKKQFLSMLAVWQTGRRKLRIRFSWSCVLHSKATHQWRCIKAWSHQPDISKAPSLINGLQAARQLHYRVITETGLTTADEMLIHPILSLVDDLVSYHAVGARSVELIKNTVL